jgi:hypothetical protein
MASSLREHINHLASSFANSVLQAIRSASIDDLLAESSGGIRRPGGRAAPRAARASVSVVEVERVAPAVAPAAPRGRRRAGRLARRNAGDIQNVIDRIVGLLRAAPKGLRAEEIRTRLGMQSKELPRPLKEAVDAGRLGKSGQKRATTYFVKGAGAPQPAAARRSAAKAARGGRPARKKK